MSEKTRQLCECNGVLIHVETVRFGYRTTCQLCGTEHIDSDYPSASVCWECNGLYVSNEAFDDSGYCPECEPNRSRLAS